MGNEFGKRLKSFRENKGYTLEEAAKRLHSTKQTVYRYEAGIIKDIPYDRIIALANIYGVEPWQIMGWNPPAETTELVPDHTMISVPIISQKISAGYGEELLNTEDMAYKKIDIFKDVIHGASHNIILGAFVKGDSMININLFPNDLVFFAKGLIEGNGIYVLAIDNEVFVKRLEFNPFDRTIDVISENDKYTRRTVSVDNEALKILGKVVGWLHNAII